MLSTGCVCVHQMKVYSLSFSSVLVSTNSREETKKNWLHLDFFFSLLAIFANFICELMSGR